MFVEELSQLGVENVDVPGKNLMISLLGNR